MTGEKKAMMVHVERIVRPVRATQRRKVRMRRELLAHLTAAMEEEGARHAIVEDALAAAKTRLGDSAALTAALQNAVPRLERLFLTRLPAPPAVDRWEVRSEKDLGHLPLSHALLLMLATFAPIILTMGTADIGSGLFDTAQLAFITIRGTDPLSLVPIALLVTAVAVALPLSALSLSAKAVHSPLRSFAVISRICLVLTLQALWVLAVTCHYFHGHPPVNAEEVLAAIAGALATVVIQLTAVRLIARLPNPLREWQSLDIAE